MRRKHPSAAQVAARKRFAAAVRAGTLKKGKTLGTSSPRKARASTKQNSARRKEARPVAKKKRHRRNKPRAAVRHRTHSKRRRNPAHRTMRGRSRHRMNPRRHHRRNPSMNLGGMGRQVLEAAKTTAIILVASAATKAVSKMVPVGQGTPAVGTTPAVAGSVPIQIAVQVGIGVALAFAAKKFMPKIAGDVLVGAMLAPMTTLLLSAPVIGPALSGAPPGLGLFSGRAVRPLGLRGAPPGLGRGGLGIWGPRSTNGQGALPRAAYYNS